MIGALLPAVVPILGDALKRLFPDAEARQRAEAELNAALLARAGELEKAAADIIKTEAQSEHWLAACWRPLMMITFGILIVLRWLGWSAPGISEAEALKLWNIVEIGLGGYVIGRSAEKTLPKLPLCQKHPPCGRARNAARAG